MFIGLLNVWRVASFSGSLQSICQKPIKCVSLSNQSCQARPALVDINFNKAFFIHLLLVLIIVLEVLALLVTHMLEYKYQIK